MMGDDAMMIQTPLELGKCNKNKANIIIPGTVLSASFVISRYADVLCTSVRLN
jgi:hypothetical protein